MQCLISIVWASLSCEELVKAENSKRKFMYTAVIEPGTPSLDNMAPYTTRLSLTDNKLLLIDFSEIQKNKTQIIMH